MNRRDTRVRQQVASHCLHYPDDVRLPLLRRALEEVPDAGLSALLDHLARSSAVAAARHYVEVFDTEADRCLHLTWFTDGDTRRRGGSLAALKLEYRRHGFRLDDGELPDYLPVLLEFAALTGEPGQRLLAGFRPALRLLHRNLLAAGTPYAAAVGSVLATVPVRDDVRPVTVGAPVEQVGVEPVLLGYPTLPERTR
ncbi:nitrate reductase molybdenum cofactor assembly chaperone [Saccharothrix sp. 6-C]|uniref:Respiratory nitrate reductase chaperone NarJ n=1 Tax=Saccharothrix texasensis TaxID=103734 RepID=A0A3N1GZM4_9PSEU|nr:MULTISPECIES: nitrate reductase molybdenum cofactor assembly chaperone [Saccharothrix]QQQ79423.1 nitrate reductase molybdenum cofactor assembly chaperone [Saccharothrix sp. 6-C]ROP35755.1 respiratory nitrate reductase chaperone NarJ [Saccharothrix texasensis]